MNASSDAAKARKRVRTEACSRHEVLAETMKDQANFLLYGKYTDGSVFTMTIRHHITSRT